MTALSPPTEYLQYPIIDRLIWSGLNAVRTGAKRGRSRHVPAIVALLCLGGAGQAIFAPAVFAQDGDAAPRTVSKSAPPSPNATVNLVYLLVKQGVLTEEQAAGLIKQAEDEAYVAREATKNASIKAQEAEKSANTAAAAASPPGTRRVTYVPEIVKRELREEIKHEVMATAQKDGWASPGAYPEWAHRIRFYGDVRMRAEVSSSFPKATTTQAICSTTTPSTPAIRLTYPR